MVAQHAEVLRDFCLGRALRDGAALAAFSGVLLAQIGCTRPSHDYESTVQIVRRTVVERDDKAEPIMVDLELEWDPCPGDQFQVIRGNRELAKCTEKFKVGDYVPVRVRHFWDPRGYYRWDISRLGSCDREIEAASEGSYEKSQECRSDDAYGMSVGFTCSRKPFRQLVATCPWMARD